MKQYSNLNHFQQHLFHTFPPPMICFLVLKNGNGRQNWVTKAGGRHIGGRLGLSYVLIFVEAFSKWAEKDFNFSVEHDIHSI